MTQSINAFDIAPNEHIALDDMTDMTDKLISSNASLLSTLTSLVSAITQSDQLTVGLRYNKV